MPARSSTSPDAAAASRSWTSGSRSAELIPLAGPAGRLSPMRSGRRALVASALAGAAFLSAGCGGKSGLGAGAAGIVPASAPAYIAVDTDAGSSQWKTVDELAGRFPDKQKGVDTIKRELRKDLGLAWEHDIKPALGPELDLAWLDFANNGENIVALLRPN